MDVERQMNDLGVDAVTGIQMMNQLGITPYDIAEPSRFMRFQDVVAHFKDNPDREFLINRITIGKNVDRLDHVWGYAELQRQKAAIDFENMKASHSLSSLDQEDPDFASKYEELKANVDNGMKKSDMVIEQIGRYER